MVSDRELRDADNLTDEDLALLKDVRMAREIAEFVAERALLFDDVDARAWSLTDFGVWAVLAGRQPLLALGPVLPPDEEAGYTED
ncbi:MAG: hypothetical protein M3Y23_05190 [Actinomycetota bacterium]|nr:hypothetical protein [Actinomycetota bacterium]